MATDAEIIEAVNAAEGNRVAAARALRMTPKMLRRLIIYIGSAKFPPPWEGGRKPKPKPKPKRKPKPEPEPPPPDASAYQESQQSAISESLIRGIHETLSSGMTPMELLSRLPPLLVAIMVQRSPARRWTPDKEWTPENLAARQEELEAELEEEFREVENPY